MERHSSRAHAVSSIRLKEIAAGADGIRDVKVEETSNGLRIETAKDTYIFHADSSSPIEGMDRGGVLIKAGDIPGH